MNAETEKNGGCKMEKVRMAIIGLGNRGYGNMKAVVSFDDVQITAVCDVYTDRAERGLRDDSHRMGIPCTDSH